MSEKQMRLGALEAGGTKMVCAVVSATARSSTVWRPRRLRPPRPSRR